MKVINTQAFCKQYPIGTMEAFVIPGYKRWITDTLYVIQSIHKITDGFYRTKTKLWVQTCL